MGNRSSASHIQQAARSSLCMLLCQVYTNAARPTMHVHMNEYVYTSSSAPTWSSEPSSFAGELCRLHQLRTYFCPQLYTCIYVFLPQPQVQRPTPTLTSSRRACPAGSSRAQLVASLLGPCRQQQQPGLPCLSRA
jgi:hypothetical protein